MEQWLRFGFVALFIVLFLRRAFRIKARTSPNQTAPSQTTMSQPVTLSVPLRPRRGKKNDFRDIPPPPENPELG
jgi:hypothetical protein